MFLMQIFEKIRVPNRHKIQAILFNYLHYNYVTTFQNNLVVEKFLYLIKIGVLL